MLDRREGAFVYRGTFQVSMRQWVGEGMRLQLETDLYDIERGDHKSASQESVYFIMFVVQPFTLLSTQL
jgi:hypothetical protein